MPFGPYADWDDCIAQNQDADDPQAVCGAIKARLEKGEDVELTAEQVRKFCPKCADKMVERHIIKLKYRTEPASTFRVAKIDEDRQLVFGWASVSQRKDGTVVLDKQGDMIAPETLEEAAYDFVLNSREGDEMHTEQVTSRLVESFMATPEKLEKMGLARDALPIGWWVGFHVDDPQAFGKVKAGQYRMFSIAGRGERKAA